MEYNSRCILIWHYLATCQLVVTENLEQVEQRNNESHIRRRRRYWTRDIFSRRERLQHGDGPNLVNRLLRDDHESFFNYSRMTPFQFDKLLNIVGPELDKGSIRQPISARDRLIITIRFLASEMCYSTLSYSYRIGKSTVHNIIKETTNVIWQCLHDEYIGVPTKEKLIETARHFYQSSRMPHCFGAIDGKHCNIVAPPNSGSLNFNYKKTFSFLLLAVCDADCNFIYVNVGAYGSESDGGVLRRSEFGNDLICNRLELPEDDFLPESTIKFPYYLVGDEAFPLLGRLLRPYGGRRLPEDEQYFNERLSSARRHIENAFGILASRFRIFQRTFQANSENAKSIIKAAVVLHNFIRKTKQTNDFVDIVPSRLCDTHQLGSNNFRREASDNRDILKNYLFEKTM